MSVVRDFCGHGLGRLFHDEPNIVHVGRAGEGIVLKPGMFFTIEPMINLGRPHVKVLSDGWTAVTRDRSLSAQFEHTDRRHRKRRGGLHVFARRTAQAAVPAVRRLPRPKKLVSLKDCRCLNYNYCGQRSGVDFMTASTQAADGKPASPSLTALSRPPRAAARPLPRGRRRGGQRLRTARAGAVPRHPAARRQTAGQGPDRQIRLLRRSRCRAAGPARRGQGHWRCRHHRTQDRASRRTAGLHAVK